MSVDLLQYFAEPQIVEPSGGHFIPVSGPQKKAYIEFLQPFIDKKKQQEIKWQ